MRLTNHKTTKMKRTESIALIAPALVQALSEIGIVKKDSKNPFLKNKYASLDAIIEATKPILAKHKLAALQIVNDEGIETIILHESGEYVTSDYIKICPEISKGLSAAQAVGVATTYAKRYQLGAMLNVSTEEDIDGQYGDNSDLKKLPLTTANFLKVIDRIKKGEVEVMQKSKDTYTLTADQLALMEKAVKEFQAGKISEQAPPTPDTTPKEQTDKTKIF